MEMRSLEGYGGATMPWIAHLSRRPFLSGRGGGGQRAAGDVRVVSLSDGCLTIVVPGAERHMPHGVGYCYRYDTRPENDVRG